MTQDELKSLLSYDISTGNFAWNYNPDWTEERNEFFKKRGFAGSKKKSGLIKINYLGIHYNAQNLAWLYVTGQTVSDVYHIDGDYSNNRFSNLTTDKLSIKQLKIATGNIKGVKVIGVCYERKSRMWTASITVNKVKIHLGKFKEKSDAVDARLAAIIKYR